MHSQAPSAVVSRTAPGTKLDSRHSSVSFRSRCEWEGSKRDFAQKTMRTVLPAALGHCGADGKSPGWTDVELDVGTIDAKVTEQPKTTEDRLQ